MKQNKYEIRKIVEASTLREALKKEKKTKVEYAVLYYDASEDEEDEEEFENGKIYGFGRK